MNEQSRFDQAPSASGAEWYRSPLVLLAGLIVFAGVLAAIVVGVTSGDDDAEIDQVAASAAPAAAESQLPPAPSFGGEGIPEVNDVVVTGEGLTAFTTPAEDESLGATAPVVQATSLGNGTKITLGPGQARVIGFFAHWCPHCQDELPELTGWLNENELPPGTQFVAVSTAVSPERDNYPPSDWFSAERWPAPVIVDDNQATLLSTFGFSGFPAFVAIDANGTVVGRAGGNIGSEGVAKLFDVFAAGDVSS